MLPGTPTAASAPDEADAIVRAGVEEGFADLKIWLDLRLQRHEAILKAFTVFGSQGETQGVSNGLPVKDGKNFQMPQELCESQWVDKLVGGRMGMANSGDRLRLAANCDVVLPPGCAPDYSKEHPPGGDELEEALPPGFAPEGLDVSSEHPMDSSPDIAKPVAARTAKVSPLWEEEAIETIPDTGSNEHGSSDDQKHEIQKMGSNYKNMKSPKVMNFQGQDWQSRMMDVFDQLDLDHSGSLDKQEFAEAFQEVGLPDVDALGVFKTLDDSANGVIDRIEWLHVIEEAARGSTEDVEVLVDFIDRLAQRQNSKGRIYDNDRTRMPCLIVRHDLPLRMTWDIMMMILLFCISLTLPYSLGFGSSKTLETVDRVFDCIFMCDVVFNFRTTFADRDDSIICDPKRIACNYFKSWFLLDFVSSAPIDLITAGLLPDMSAARILKIGKIAKVMKLLRISKMLKVFQGSELMEKIEEKSTSKAHQTVNRCLGLFLIMLIMSHWLACFGAAIDKTALESYIAGKVVDPTNFQTYLAGFYCSVTTLTTVGYGDITPETDAERIYAMFAMIIGAAFYGYIIGSITSIVTDMDLNRRSFYDRMDLVQAWLDRHQHIPKILRRRVRKHYKITLLMKAAVDDASIVCDLSPELRADTAYFILHDHVRHNPMFYDISNTALANLVAVIEKNYVAANEFIVKVGDPGLAMYVMVEGVARYDRGQQWRPPDAAHPDVARFQQIIEGDSFGEEIIFELEETYQYTVIATTACHVHLISEDGFKDRYRNMPELRNQMFRSFLKSRGSEAEDLEEIEELCKAASERRISKAAGTKRPVPKKAAKRRQGAHPQRGAGARRR